MTPLDIPGILDEDALAARFNGGDE